MKKILALVALFLLPATVVSAGTMLGFSEEGANEEAELEAEFDSHLDKRGIAVEGNIAIARYGRSWRGIKPKVAAEKGAIGCILYSDPGDDGFAAGDTYPQGGYRPPQGAQRGSVADMPLFAGDPLTPFIGTTADAERLPLSWKDAAPLLEALDGPVVPQDWRGGLPEGGGQAPVSPHTGFPKGPQGQGTAV